jgi:hypothetical protein
MKALILTALIGIAISTTGAVSARADTFTLHGVFDGR